MSYRIQVGDAIPTFTAKDQEGNVITSEDLIGTPVVLYFYPKDNTPGCTQEACAFRDHMEKLAAFDVAVVGVSPDSESSHQKFIEKNNLNFTLLTDEKQELCNKFGVIQQLQMAGKPYMGVERTTFLIDRDGIVVWLERPVKVDGHIERVIAAIHEHLK